MKIISKLAPLAFALAFVQRRPWLAAVILIWIFLYLHSAFHNENELYQGGGYTITLPIFVLFSFNLFVFITCLTLVVVNLFKRRFSWRDDSFILMSLVLARVFFHVPYIRADMAVKALFFSQVPSLCESSAQSKYLNQIGFKYCYEWVSYPEARFVVISPDVELTDVNLPKYPSDNWPPQLLAEIKKEKKGYRFMEQCGYKEVHKSFNDVYYIRAFCE